MLGAGDWLRLLSIVFAAAWVRFGARGPQFIAVGLILVIVVAPIIIVPSRGTIAANFQLWWLVVTAGVAIMLACLRTWLPLRPAIVR